LDDIYVLLTAKSSLYYSAEPSLAASLTQLISCREPMHITYSISPCFLSASSADQYNPKCQRAEMQQRESCRI